MCSLLCSHDFIWLLGELLLHSGRFFSCVVAVAVCCVGVPVLEVGRVCGELGLALACDRRLWRWSHYGRTCVGGRFLGFARLRC